MTPCPADSVLHRFLADAVPASDARAVERHLDGCAGCRRRLDGFADVTALGTALAEAAGWQPTPAPGLALAIERLEREATACLAAGEPAGPVTPLPTLPALPPTDRPGFIGRLGDIEIRRVIGRGGMGVVYEGLDPALDRQVAVKVLSPHLVGDGEAKERFLREARAVAALTDDHVVTIHAIDQADGMQFLVLQHIVGESLAELLTRDGRLPVEAVARIGAQVARGLAAAHARGLVHRDVKPANILLEQGTGVARLTDFGLAKLIGRTSVTGPGMLAGTPGYMSPEQAAGQEIDGRSDLFSLGVVLYAAAAGRVPFNGDAPLVVLFQIRTQSPKPLLKIDPSLPKWFCAVVDRLLEKDPAKRIQTAAEVVNLLERRADRPTARRPGAAYWAVVAAAVAALAVVVGQAAHLSRPTPAGQVASTPSAPSAVEVAPGFVIVGRPDHFPTLGEAVQAAADGDIVEVHGNGPHRERRVEIVGKKLIVRAAAGYRPRIQPAAPGQRAEPQWLNSDSELTVEGLDIFWPVLGPKPPFDPTNSPAVLGGIRGKLTIRGCRIVCGKQAGCILTGARELTIEGCFLAADAGVAIGWRAPAGGRLRVTGSVIEAASALFVIAPADGGPESGPAAVELTRNTVAAKGAIGFIYQVQPRQKVRVEARRNIFRVNHVFGVPARTKSPAEAPVSLRQILDWTERENVYDRQCNYLVGIKASPITLTPAGVDSLDEWLAFWKAKETGSVEGDVQFQVRPPVDLPTPLRLDRIDKPSGMLPDPVGAGELPFK